MKCAFCGQELMISSFNGARVDVCTNQNCSAYCGNDANNPKQSGVSIYGGGSRFNALSTSVGSLANTSFNIPWNTERSKGQDFSHATDSPVVTCNFTGEIEIVATARTLGSNRVEATLNLLVNGVSVPDAIASNYMSRDTDQDLGTVELKWWTTVTSGDYLEVEVSGNTDGAAILTVGTRIDVKRVL